VSPVVDFVIVRVCRQCLLMSLRQPAWTRIAPALAIVVIIIGVVVTVLGFPHPASFGWFASAPLSEAAFDPNYVVIVPWSAIV